MKALIRTSIVIFILANLFLLTEGALRLTLPDVPEANMGRDKKLYVDHPKFIFQHVKDQVVTESKTVGDQIIFENVKYTFDEYSRRKTWIEPEIKKDGAALFFGSSVVFGKGVNDKETLPSQFAIKNPNLEVYNYAVRGWGTQQYLELLRDRDLQLEVANPIKYLIFVISVNKETGHVQRLKGTMDLCTPCWWMVNLPAYRKSKETGRFEFKGTFDKYMPIRFYLFKFLQNLRIIRYFRINVSKVDLDDYVTYVDLLLEIRNLAQSQFPEARIVFLNHPFSDLESTNLLMISSNYSGLSILDYSELIPKQELSKYYFGVQWPFPKPSLNHAIADKISADLLFY